MKHNVTRLFASIILISMLGSGIYSQTSTPSTTPTDRAALITLCEKAKDEVIASRALIASYEETLKSAEKGKALSEQETAAVRDALAKERDAMAKKQLEVDEYKKALAKEVKKKNFYKNLFKITGTVAVVAIALLVLKK